MSTLARALLAFPSVWASSSGWIFSSVWVFSFVWVFSVPATSLAVAQTGAPLVIEPGTDAARRVAAEGAVRSIPGGWLVERPTAIAWPLEADSIARLVAADELTFEAWALPYPAPDERGLPAPQSARLLALGIDERHRNLAFDIDLEADGEHAVVSWFLRTSETSAEGGPRRTAEVELTGRRPHHFALTRAVDGTEHLYVDGRRVAMHALRGTLATWDATATLTLFGEPAAYRAWYGQLHRLALAPRALSEAEVRARSERGPALPAVGWLAATPTRQLALALRGDVLGGDVLSWLENQGGGPLTWRASLQSAPAWLHLGGARLGDLEPGARAPLRLGLRDVPTIPLGRHTAQLVLDIEAPGAPAERLVRAIVIDRLPGADLRPSEADTGPRLTTLETRPEGFTLRRTGEVLEGVHVQGALLIDADDVTLRDVIVDGGDARFAVRVAPGRRNVRIERALLCGGREATLCAGACALRGVRVEPSEGIGLLLLGDVTVERTWVRGGAGDAPAVAIVETGRVGLFEVRIDASGTRSAALAIDSARGPVQGVALERSWLGGGVYTLAVTDGGHGAPTGIALRDNVFSGGEREGTILAVSTADWHCSGNTFASSGLPVRME